MTLTPVPTRSAPLARWLTVGVGLAAAAAAVLLVWPARPQAQGGGAPPAVPVDVAAAVQRELAETEEFTARLEAADLVEVRPRVAGAIQRVHVQDGARVARGALLFTIDPGPFEAEVARAEAALGTATAQEALARKEIERARALLAQQAASAQEVDQLAAAADTAAAAVRQAQATLRSARLNLGYTALRAPVAGQVSRVDVTLGNYVNDQRVLTTLVGARQGAPRVHAWFDVSEATYLRLRQNPDVQREVAMGLADEPALPRRGRVDVIDNRLNPQTGTIRLRAVFDDPEGQLLPGLFARIRVQAGKPQPVIVTPDRAVATDQNRKLVWVVGADGVVQPRPVTLGALVDGMRVVTSGVAAGEAVVVGGLQRVRPGLPVAANRLPLDERGMPLPPAPAGGQPTEPRT